MIKIIVSTTNIARLIIQINELLVVSFFNLNPAKPIFDLGINRSTIRAFITKLSTLLDALNTKSMLAGKLANF